ncbi:MAG TPA: hypothetical protein VKA21_01985 [Candidatus Binatia bacterium]|nr:hypothetical protein [Candidatus Binatia bacterium]
MRFPPELVEIERVRFWEGQLLRARDFRTQVAADAQRRWWHVRALHDAFGVRFGLETSLVDETGVPALAVEPGLAYDTFGRPLIVSARREVRIPDRGLPATLLLRVASVPLRASEEEAAVEPAASRRRHRDEPSLVWRAGASASPRDGVPLVRVLPDPDGPALAPSPRAPRARPASRPHLASGHTIAGNTPWEVWIEPGLGGGQQTAAVGIQTRVDTTTAGFTRTPYYFASVHGTLWSRSSRGFLAGFFTHVADATPTGFTVRLMMRGIPRRGRLPGTTDGVAVSDAEVARGRTRATSERAGHEPVRLTAAQNRLRVADTTGLRPGDGVIVHGVDARSGLAATVPVVVAAVEHDAGTVILRPSAAGPADFELEGSELAVTATLNSDFAATFTSFARRRRLFVGWVGCEEHVRTSREEP